MEAGVPTLALEPPRKAGKGGYRSWRHCIGASLYSDRHRGRRRGARWGGHRSGRWRAGGADVVSLPHHVAVQAAHGVVAVAGEVGLLIYDGPCKAKGQGMSGAVLGGGTARTDQAHGMWQAASGQMSLEQLHKDSYSEAVITETRNPPFHTTASCGSSTRDRAAHTTTRPTSPTCRIEFARHTAVARRGRRCCPAG